MKTVRVLVLGATGRLGSMLRRYWKTPDTEPYLEPLWQARQGHIPAEGDWVVFDPRTDPLALAQACARVDLVLDLAGPVPGPGRSVDSFAAIPALVRAVAHGAGGKPLLWASSAAVYGARAVCTETDAPAPLSPYGQAKMTGEALLADVAGACALRIGNVAGADALLSALKPGVVPTLDVFADGTTPRRSYMGPRTLAETLAHLVRAAMAGRLPTCLNVTAPGPGVEMGALLDAAGVRWQPRAAPEAALPAVVLDTALLRGHVPLSPETGEARAIEREWRADEALKQALYKGIAQ